MKKIPLIIYCDTETEHGFQGQAISIQYIFESEKRTSKPGIILGYNCWKIFIEKIREEIKLIDTNKNIFTEVEIILFFHNAGYDLLRVWGQLPDATTSYILSGSAVIKATLKIDELTIDVRDSLRMLPASLSQLARSFKTTEKLEFEDYENFDGNNIKHIEYALNDVVVLREILHKYATLINTKVKDLKLTVASQALSAFKNMYKDETKIDWKGINRITNEKINKEFYGGGRVIMKTENLDNLDDCVSFDITSSYPYCMLTGLFPSAGKEPTIIRKGVDFSKLSGIWMARIKIIDYKSSLPILRFKSKNSTIYPTGTFESTITNEEYNYLKSKNEFKKIIWLGGYNYQPEYLEPIFKSYIEKYYSIKNEGDKLNLIEKGSGEALRTIAKLMLNSLYGKLAQKYNEEEPIIIGPHPDLFEKEISTFKNDHRNSFIPSIITANARLNLYRMYDFYGIDNIVYADTDSVKIKIDAFNSKPKPDFINDELGGWKFEGECFQVHVHAPKVYSYLDENGNCILKAKGVKLNDKAKVYVDEFLIATYNKDSKNDYLLKIRKELIKNSEIIVKYGATPIKIRTHAKTGALFNTPHRALTARKNVAGMIYCEESNSYNYHEIKSGN